MARNYHASARKEQSRKRNHVEVDLSSWYRLIPQTLNKPDLFAQVVRQRVGIARTLCGDVRAQSLLYSNLHTLVNACFGGDCRGFKHLLGLYQRLGVLDMPKFKREFGTRLKQLQSRSDYKGQ